MVSSKQRALLIGARAVHYPSARRARSRRSAIALRAYARARLALGRNRARHAERARDRARSLELRSQERARVKAPRFPNDSVHLLNGGRGRRRRGTSWGGGPAAEKSTAPRVLARGEAG